MPKSRSKPKGAKQKGWVQRDMEEREPKQVEDPKSALIMKGLRTSNEISQLLTNLSMMKKPFAVAYKKRNAIHPFEDATSLEFLTNKSNCSLFVHGSHSKKRPNNLTFGRVFDFNILDMIEVHVEKFIPIEDFKGPAWNIGSKPGVIFQGQEFEHDENLKKFANYLLDFFRGPEVPKISLAGLDHVIVCTSLQDKVYFRHYSVVMKKSGTKIPRIELVEVGPRIDMAVLRVRTGASDLVTEAYTVPKTHNAVKHKNITINELQDKLGTVHMERQDFHMAEGKKMKALKRSRRDDEFNGELKIKKSRMS